MEYRLLSAAGLLLLVTFGCVCDARTKFRLSSDDVQKLFPAGRAGPRTLAQQLVRQPPSTWQQPHRVPALVPAREPGRLQSKQRSEFPLAWSYPVPEEPLAKSVVESQAMEPIPADTVAAQCGERAVRVEVKRDLLGIGQLIYPAHLTLGGCADSREDSTEQTLVFESELNSCGSQLMMTEDSLIYTFTLIYEPKALGDSPIVKTSNAVVGIECHYLRNQDVSSNMLNPTAVPFTGQRVSEELLYFSLKLMTDDWRFERPINQYVLGDIINIQASAMQYHHIPLRVFVDSCVATLVPYDVNVMPRYYFINNFGCLVDAKLTGSSSRFLPRSQDDQLQFQLEAFRFQEQTSDSIYITCHLTAGPAASTEDNGKACSFIDGWRSADGNDAVCGCCESSCSMEAGDVKTGRDFVWEGDATMGPIKVRT